MSPLLQMLLELESGALRGELEGSYFFGAGGGPVRRWWSAWV